MNSRIAAAALAMVVFAAGCASSPPPRRLPPAEPVAPPRVYVYPQQGQSPAQLDRDRFECHGWATRESGFDPSRHALSAAARTEVVPVRAPGESVAAGAVAGAVIGAVVAGHGDAAKGAVIGAAAGGMLGGLAASAEAQEAGRVERRYVQREGFRHEREAAGYRRALSACLEGRGYSVK